MAKRGQQALFVLPAVLFTVAMVIFPTVFGLYIAFTDWNLARSNGPQIQRASTIFGNCCTTPTSGTRCATWFSMCWRCFVEYAIAFGLALLLNAEIRARKFFRVAFPAAPDAEPRRRELDDRQVADGISIRAGGDAGALSRLGQSGLLRVALDGPASHHGDGRLGFDPFHDDHAARRAAGAAEGDPGGGQGRRRERLAVVLA